MSTDPKFPLGAPINRPPPAGPKPIPGQPGWVMDKGVRRYVETNAPLPKAAP